MVFKKLECLHSLRQGKGKADTWCQPMEELTSKKDNLGPPCRRERARSVMEGTTVYPGLLRHIPCPAFKPKPHVRTEGKLEVGGSLDLVSFPSAATLNTVRVSRFLRCIKVLLGAGTWFWFVKTARAQTDLTMVVTLVCALFISRFKSHHLEVRRRRNPDAH